MLGRRRRRLFASLAVLLVACGGATREGSEPPSGGGSAGDGGQGSGGGAGGAGGARPSTGGAGPSSGGARPSTGGAGPSSGGVPPRLPDCEKPVVEGTACSVSGSHCGGPCSNSWQAESVCENGTWSYLRVVPCGPNADHAPKCKNSFGGGEATPCCAEDKPDCAGKPDGYPGFGCTPGDGSFCSCSCSTFGGWLCAC